ncbi:MAG: polysaccharide deacetylase family protein [Pyrinomonadaceae bacterium]
MNIRVRTFAYCLALCAALFGAITVGAQQPVSRQPSAPSDAAKSGALRRRVAVTIDDLPFTGDGGKYDASALRELTAKLLASLKANKIPAIGFVNERKLENAGETKARTALLRLWLDAGMDLGNHTYSHPSFFRTPLANFQEEVLKGERVTRRLLAERGRKPRYFRHPFLNTGPDLKTKQAFEKFLAAHDYAVAPVTIDNMEWVFAREYTKARQSADAETMRRIAEEYVPYMDQMFAFYEQLSRELFGLEVAQILLIHANALNADHFGELAAMMKRRGYEFVSLEEALKDKAYQQPDTYTGPVGISWLQRWLVTRGGEFRKEPYLPPYTRQFDSDSSGSDFKTRKGK